MKCRPLKSQWGTERFGLADTVVLQAIEVRAGGGGGWGWAGPVSRVAGQGTSRRARTMPVGGRSAARGAAKVLHGATEPEGAKLRMPDA